MTEIITCLQGLTTTNGEEVQRQLAVVVNHLLLTNFSALVEVLYRVDVQEEKLKNLLKENGTTDAGWLIAGMLIEREQQKRLQRFTPPPLIADDEAW